MAEGLVYVYGVSRPFDAAALRDIRGIAGSVVRLVEDGRLAGVVGTVDGNDFSEASLPARLRDLAWLEPVARAHHEVVAAVSRHAAVAPMRLATIYNDDARVRAMLADRGNRLDRALSRIDGRSEWGLKAYVDPARLPARAPEPAEADTAARPGTAYLLRRKAGRQEHERRLAEAASAVEAIHAGLEAIVDATAIHPLQDPRLAGRSDRMLLNAAYLVAHAKEAAFREAVDRAAAEHPRIALELTGPWAPYSFVADVG